MKEKVSENQRLQSSFNSIRESYNKVKEEKDQLRETCSQLRKKNQALESRLKNLKMMVPKSESLEKNVDEKSPSNKQNALTENTTHSSGNSKRSITQSVQKPGAPKFAVKACDIFKGPVSSILKDLIAWFCEMQLQPIIRLSVDNRNKRCDDKLDERRNECLDRCLVILPRITDLLHLHLNKHSSIQLDDVLLCHCLKFLHFVFLLMDQDEGTKKRKVASTLHRLGETLHQQFLLPSCETQIEPNSLKEDLRVCGSFVVLHTVSQIDILVHSWKTLKSAVSSLSGRQCFTKFYGHVCILLLMECKEHVFLSSQLSRAIDVLLCMFVDQDSDEAKEVRRVLSSSVFIKPVCSLLSMNTGGSDNAVQVEIKEKLIVLLQQVVKRDADAAVLRVMNEHKLVKVLQKELSFCLSLASDRVSSYEFLLKSTLSLLSAFDSKTKV